MAKKKPVESKESKPKPKPKPKAKEEWQYEKIASIVGKWAWVILLLDALIYIILGIYYEVVAFQLVQQACAGWPVGLLGPCPAVYTVSATDVWYIVGAIITVIYAVLIVRPRFSNKCAEKDWDYLMNDVVVLGGYRIPWMFIWSILAAIFGQGWGTFHILLPALILPFAGPKPYGCKA